jgi:DegV family protein with EDD domain
MLPRRYALKLPRLKKEGGAIMAVDYDIYADSAGDFNAEQLKILHAEGVTILDIPFVIGTFDSDKDGTLGLEEFYLRIDLGEEAHTAAITRGRFYEAFKTSLADGKDVLYLSFTSGASALYEESLAAAEMAMADYPEHKVVCVDTLAASQGIAMLVMKAVELRQEGRTIDDVAQWVNDNRLCIHHVFSVDDLAQLAKGGRLPKQLRNFIDKFGLKLILHINSDGKISVSPTALARSIEGSYKRMTKIALSYGIGIAEQTVHIVDGCNEKGVNLLLGNIVDKCAGIVRGNVGPAIGCHTGPSVVALFFWGNAR